MPTTGDTWIQLETGQILDFSRLKTDFLETVRDGLAGFQAGIYGNDTTIGSAWATFTVAADTIDLDATRKGITPSGHLITADATDPAWQTIPFANVGATLYHVGVRRQLRPSDVTGNTTDGQISYNQMIEDVGELGEPDTVTDHGSGLYLDIAADPAGLVGTGWAGAATRPVVVWLATPETAGGDAIYEGEIEWDAGASTHRITIPHYLGQDADAPSTDPADYRVLVRGPTITTNPLGTDPGIWYLGNVQSGAWATSGQNLVPSWGTWLALFQVEHDNATGAHTQISAYGVDLYGGQPGAQLRQVYTAAELASFMPGFEQASGTNQAGTFFKASAGEPYNVRTASPVSGSYAALTIPARLPHDVAFTIRELAVGAYIDNPSPTQKLVVELIKRTPNALGVLNGTVVGTWEATGFTAATWAHRKTWTGTTLPLTVAAPAADEAFFWRFSFYEPNPAQVRISAFETFCTATRIEPWR